MNAPRNRVRFDAALADREAIRTVLATRRQDQPLFTPKEILRTLEWPDRKLRAVRRQIHLIRSGG
jgi:hypothetical protein